MSVDLAKLRNLADAARAKTQALAKREARSWFQVTNLAGPGGQPRAEIAIYDEIGAWGVSAQDFADELRGVTANAIDLRINSSGGSVADGLTIYEAIRRHPAHITSHVDGLAASAASFITQGADHRVIAASGILLIHDAEASLSGGTAADFAEMGELMTEMSNTIAAIYAERAGGDVATWRDRMRAGGMNLGTRYVGQAAVDAGLADEVAGAKQPGVAPPTNAAPLVAASTNHTPDVEAFTFDVEAFQRALREGLR